MKYALITIVLITLGFNAKAQVISDFEDGTVQDWFSEGDGNVSWSASGVPGGALRVNDDATGDTNWAIAPSDFLGDWSAAGSSDSLSCDLYFDRLGGSFLPSPRPYFFQISGPGGKARAIVPNPSPPEITWVKKAVSMDQGDWTMISGTWGALLAQVTELRLLAEYVDGDEFVLIDNVTLSINPPEVIQNVFQCSDFDDNNFDGWTFEGSSGTVSPGEGNPETAIRISDMLGPGSRGIAPPRFRGNWSALDGSGIIGYDFRIASGTTLLGGAENNLIIISGPGGEARYSDTLSTISAALGNWSRIETTLDSSNWVVTIGSWPALLAEITRIDIRLEFINGSETVYFDNFCLGNPCTALPTGLSDIVGPSGVTVSWNSQANQGAIGYRVGGRPVGAGGFAYKKVAEPNASFFVPGSKLIADTTYEWQVEAVCTVDGSVRTPAATDSFYVPPLRISAEMDVSVYPNPTASLLYIEGTDLQLLEIFDINGREIYTRDQPGVLDLSFLSPASYWIRITDNNKVQSVQPLQIVR